LDWGCGPGRIVRHLPASITGTEIHGTDYNQEYIDWCQRELDKIKFSVNHIDPPTNYLDSFFDAVIGVSIFTHLSEASHVAWMNELYRITKPAGIIFITTQGVAYRSKLTSTERSHFDKGYLVTRRYINEGNRLFSTFQPPEFIKRIVADQRKTTVLFFLKTSESDLIIK
jgi:cyclopropane fatty-acyl-phospholipid synthase-like methyltransferase